MLIQNSVLLNYTHGQRKYRLKIPNGLFSEVKFQLDDKIYVTKNIRNLAHLLVHLLKN